MENTVENILEEPVIKLVPASVGKRFVNYLTDILIFSFLASFLIVFTAPFFAWSNNILNKPETVGFVDQLVISFIYGLYMSFTEAILKGKTIGKYITRTRAVTLEGYNITAQMAFIRGLIRLIPFEQLSAISLSFEPLSLLPPFTWHDRLSKSFVVDEIKSELPQK